MQRPKKPSTEQKLLGIKEQLRDPNERILEALKEKEKRKEEWRGSAH